jgi:hypothetical protein
MRTDPVGTGRCRARPRICRTVSSSESAFLRNDQIPQGSETTRCAKSGRAVIVQKSSGAINSRNSHEASPEVARAAGTDLSQDGGFTNEGALIFSWGHIGGERSLNFGRKARKAMGAPDDFVDNDAVRLDQRLSRPSHCGEPTKIIAAT